MSQYWTESELHGGHYLRFSEGEYERRQANVREMMNEHEIDVLAIYADSAVARHNYANLHYLANYMGQAHAYLVFFADPDEEATLLFGFINHGPYVSTVSVIEDVRWGSRNPAKKVVERINNADAETETLGIVGTNPAYGITIPHDHYETFDRELDVKVIDVTDAYERLRLIKSDEEIEFTTKAAALTDAAMEAVVEKVDQDVQEIDLKGALESASLLKGGYPFISFITSAPMDDAAPESCYPWKEASGRTLQDGDIVTTELSAAYWGYIGQIHRPIAVGSSPTAMYQDIYDVTLEAYEGILDALKPGNTVADVRDAVRPIEEAGYKIHDGSLHGFGMQLEEPHVGATTPENWIDLPTEDVRAFETSGDWEFAKNMVMVIQPNAITPDRKHGLQLGNTVVIRDDGAEVLTEYPVEFVQV